MTIPDTVTIADYGFDPEPSQNAVRRRLRARVSAQTDQRADITATLRSLVAQRRRLGTTTWGREEYRRELARLNRRIAATREQLSEQTAQVRQARNLLDVYKQQVQLMGWMPGPLLQLYARKWIETGRDADLALAAVRASDLYDKYLPGNRQNGRILNPEKTYFAKIASFQQTIARRGLNPDIFSNLYGNLIGGEVSPVEFEQRVDLAYNQLLDNLPAVRQYYANVVDPELAGLTDEAILAAFLSPDVSTDILTRKVSLAQIGGAAAQRGYQLGLNRAGRLLAAGLTGDEALSFYSQAARQVPVIGRLVERFNEHVPFGITQYENAAIMGNPNALRRIEQALARETATFTSNLDELERGDIVGMVQGLNPM